MCGIVGGVSREADWPARDTSLQAVASLRHRGPDATGLYESGPVFLGHARLSILDLDARANQPMCRANHVVTFNGEIYNFREIRKDLEARGCRLTTESDTETLLHAYAVYGPECVQRLEGMFAFAIWDSAEKRLFLARDRFGEKPLFYYWDERRFAFASELPALEHLIGSSHLHDDPEAIGLYFLYSYIPAPRSPYRRVRQLEPGTWLRLDLEGWGLRNGSYYRVQEIKRQAEPIDYGTALEQLRHRLRQSVQQRLSTSDVPVALFLSGGLDSSIIATLANELSNGSVAAYTVAFPEDPAFDESEYATIVASQLDRIAHKIVHVTERDLQDFTPDVLRRLGEPFADASLIPTAYLCKHVDEKVILGGDGADEIFAGYGSYHALWLSAALPSWVKRALLTLPAYQHPEQVRNRWLRALFLYRKYLSTDVWKEYFNWREYAGLDMLAEMGVPITGQQDVHATYRWGVDACLRDIQMTDIRFNLPNDMLKKVDYASMMSSLEVRLPYLDSSLVKWALELPDAYKIRGMTRKRILRDAFASSLPAAILKKPKQGFLLPIRQWFRKGRLRDEMHDLLNGQAAFNQKGAREILDAHVAGKVDHSVFLWELYVYLTWRRRTCH